MSTDKKTKSTVERAEIDPVFKEVLTFNFGKLDIPLQTQVEVSRLPRTMSCALDSSRTELRLNEADMSTTHKTMDALVILQQNEDLKKVREETVFSYFRVHNQIEFKGKEDILTRAGYHIILGRANLYLGEKDISAKDMTVTIVSARKPIKVLRHCQDDVRWEEVDVGHYVSINPFLPVHLFVSNELAIEPKNYPLLLFAASKKKFHQFVERIVSENNTVCIYHAHFIDYEMTEEVLAMAGKQSLYQKNLERVTQDLLSIIGKDKLLMMMTPEERVHGLTPEELLRGLDSKTQEKLKQLILNQEKQGERACPSVF
ncbi:hypothetical protein FJZ31_14820 [Candidatus Poribacteria bacterium]|nr:hypothetical protein [Candidatus Poribacteria bacterium]